MLAVILQAIDNGGEIPQKVKDNINSAWGATTKALKELSQVKAKLYKVKGSSHARDSLEKILQMEPAMQARLCVSIFCCSACA